MEGEAQKVIDEECKTLRLRFVGGGDSDRGEEKFNVVSDSTGYLN